MNTLLLAAAFVSLLSWSPSGADSRDPTTAGSRMLAPGLENGVLRAAPPWPGPRNWIVRSTAVPSHLPPPARFH